MASQSGWVDGQHFSSTTVKFRGLGLSRFFISETYGVWVLLSFWAALPSAAGGGALRRDDNDNHDGKHAKWRSLVGSTCSRMKMRTSGLLELLTIAPLRLPGAFVAAWWSISLARSIISYRKTEAEQLKRAFKYILLY